MIRRLSAYLLASLLAALASSAYASEPGPKPRFIYTGDRDFPPYDFIDGNGVATGFNVELIHALARDAGVDIEVRLTDWNQARADLDAGKADLISLSFSEERVKSYLWLARTWAMHQCILFRERQGNYPDGLNHLAGETIAAQERSAVAEALLALPSPQPSVMTVSTQVEALRLLKDGVATGVGGNSLSLNVAAARLGLSGLVELPLRAVPYGLMSARGRGAELAWVPASMAHLQSSGTVEALAEKYLAVPRPGRTWRDYAIWALSILGLIVAARGIASAGNRALRRRVRQRTRELETAVAEGEALGRSLATSEERYKTFLALSSEGIARIELSEPLSVDKSEDEQVSHVYRTGRYAECNHVFARIAGAAGPAEVIGRGISDLITDVEIRDLIRIFTRGGYRVQDIEIPRTHADGSIQWLSVSGVGVIDHGFLVGIWVTHTDVTLRRQVEEELRTRGRILEAVAFSAAHLLEPGPWEEHAPEVLARLGRAVDAGCAYIFRNEESDERGLACHFVREWTSEGAPRLLSEPSVRDGFIWPKDGPVHLLLADRKTVAILVKDLPPEGRRVFGSLELKSMLIVPIFVEGTWWGLLGFGDFESERNWLPSETEALRTAASALGAALLRERDEETMRASEKRYRDLFDFAPAGIYQSRHDGTLIAANRELARLLGYPKTEDVLDLILGDDVYFEASDRARLIAAYEARGHAERIEVRMKRRGGLPFWAELSAHAIKDDSGQTSYFEGFIQDISDRKTAEDEMRASEERYRRLFEGNPLPMVLYDVEGLGLLDVNEAAVTQYGYTREELLSLSLKELSSPDDVTFAPFFATRLDPRPDLVQVGIRPQRRKDGSTLDVEITSLAVPLGGRKARLLLSRDVTAERKAAAEREQMSRAIERAADEWHRTFDSVDVALVVLDQHGRVTRLNRSARDLLGREYASVLGAALPDLDLPEPWRSAGEVAESALKTRTVASTRAVEGAGRRTWELVAYLAPAGQGGEERIILTVRDVTRLVALQESLRHSETMSAMGSLVAGVAHEVRNPLFSISATVDALESELGEKQEYAELTVLLRSQVGRLRQLMRDLLDYGKPPVLRRTVVNPREILRRAMRGCAALSREREVTLLDEVPEGLPSLSVDPIRMEQVFQNLLANAIQHSPRASRVRATARSCDGPEPAIEFTVQDEGTGLAAAEIVHLFEPFFSRRKGGTGLGLSIVQRIVEAHGGSVMASNREGGGAVFLVRLPATTIETTEAGNG